MSRVEMIELGSAEGATATMFDSVTAMLGRVPNSYRVLAHAPLVAQFLLPFNAVVQRQGGGGVLPTRLKEMAVIKTSHVNACNY